MAFNGMNFGTFQSGVKQLLRSSFAAGVAISFKDSNLYTLNSIVLKAGKSDLEIVETKTSLDKIGDLSIDPMVPVNLVLNGKGIVHKMVEAEIDTSDNVLLQQVLPNARLEDFYVDKSLATDGRYMISVLRKDQVDSVLKDFSKHDLYVVSASFGPFALHSVRTLLNGAIDENWSVHVAGHHLEYESDKLVSYETESGSGSQVEIGGELIGEESVIPFAAAFEFLFKSADERPTGAPAIVTAREEIKQRKLFQVAGISVLGIFLFALLANFMLFSSYSDSYRHLEADLFQSKDRIAYLSNLDADVSAKQGLLRKLGLLTPARTSFYADAIAASVPRTIKLTGMELNPLKKKVKTGETPVFDSGTINIVGTSKKSTTMNDWVKLLKEMDWVERVSVVDYQSTGSSASGEFELAIGLK